MNIFLVIVYIDKVNKSQVNDSEKVNEVNFQQEEIDVPKDVLNQSVKDTELEQITARSKISQVMRKIIQACKRLIPIKHLKEILIKAFK